MDRLCEKGAAAEAAAAAAAAAMEDGAAKYEQSVGQGVTCKLVLRLPIM